MSDSTTYIERHEQDILFRILHTGVKTKYYKLVGGAVTAYEVGDMLCGLDSPDYQFAQSEWGKVSLLLDCGYAELAGLDAKYVRLTQKGITAVSRNPNYASIFLPQLDSIVFAWHLLTEFNECREHARREDGFVFTLEVNDLPKISLESVTANLRWTKPKAAYTVPDLTFTENTYVGVFATARREMNKLASFVSGLYSRIDADIAYKKASGAYPYKHHVLTTADEVVTAKKENSVHDAIRELEEDTIARIKSIFATLKERTDHV